MECGLRWLEDETGTEKSSTLLCMITECVIVAERDVYHGYENIKLAYVYCIQKSMPFSAQLAGL